MNTAPAGGSSPMDLLDDVMIGGGGPQRPVVNTTFVKVPFKPVVQRTQAGNQRQAFGIEIQAAMTRLNQNSAQCIVKLKITNHTVDVLRDFLFKMNVNYFGYTVDQGIP